MRVRDLMTTRVFTIAADKKLLVAEDIMGWAKVRHVPVVDEHKRVVGLISHRDLLRASLASWRQSFTSVDNRQHLAQIAIGDVMAKNVATIDPDATVQAAARMMRHGKRGCLPVVDAHERLLGIITAHDLLAVLERFDLDALLAELGANDDTAEPRRAAPTSTGTPRL